MIFQGYIQDTSDEMNTTEDLIHKMSGIHTKQTSF